VPFVLDASVAMAWCFEDEGTPDADRVLSTLERDVALVPSIWPLEVANALCVAERRKRLQASDSARFAELLYALPITVEPAPLERVLGPVLALARAQGLSSYDAAYIELAMREGLLLATLDGRLRASAKRVGVRGF
jgi:predicted nucleic acid-binding protein